MSGVCHTGLFPCIPKLQSNNQNKERLKPHTFSEGFGEAPGNEYVLRPLYLQVPFYKWYLLGIATPMPRQPLFPDIYNYSHPSQWLTTVITVTFKSPFKCLIQ